MNDELEEISKEASRIRVSSVIARPMYSVKGDVKQYDKACTTKAETSR
jgi:hypothetical protein